MKSAVHVGVLVCLAVYAVTATAEDLLFIHHSVGQNWLDHSLRDALTAKGYIDQVNEITYGTELSPDSGRPDSLGSVPGDSTDMNAWLLWFNDYPARVQAFPGGRINAIVMFKSCFPNSDITSDGDEPGDPLGDLTLTNLKAIYRHPDGPGHTYSIDSRTYRPLEDVFAAHPDTLFIPVTAPPLNNSSTDNAAAHRARQFNNWLKGTWLASYNAAHPTLKNVAVFDLFNELANSDSAVFFPNRLKSAYGGATDDSHPNNAANGHLTAVFATNAGNFIDAAWTDFATAVPEGEPPAEGEVQPEGEGEAPAEGEVQAEGEGEAPAEGEVQAEGEGEGASEGEIVAEGEGEGGETTHHGCAGAAGTLGNITPKPPMGGTGGDGLFLISAMAVMVLAAKGRMRTIRQRV